MFNWGNFISHSGQYLDWKIECDDLTDKDIDCLARIIHKNYSFCAVYGVPRGGTRLANALQRYCDPKQEAVLIVDDVFTTGKSMHEMRKKVENTEGKKMIVGVVIFSRSPMEEQFNWITPLFESTFR